MQVMSNVRPLLSIAVPCYNEQANIEQFYKKLKTVISKLPGYRFELIFVNDGSNDGTLERLHKIAGRDKSVRVLSLSRNFGKEIAISAGIASARGDALITIDSDGQHPATLIPQLIRRWRGGGQVVIGVRRTSAAEGFAKKSGSWAFYKIFNRLSGLYLVPGATDFRLIDKAVQAEFIKLTEQKRIARGLIDWLGFKRDFVYFQASPRSSGEPGYSLGKLFGLAVNSFVSLSLKPLYFSFYIGVFILPLAILLAAFSITEMLIGDPLKLNITGSAYLMELTLFLVGLVLAAQGITALYLSHIHAESQNRPLYVVDQKDSRRL